MMFIPKGCTLTIHGPQYVAVGGDAFPPTFHTQTGYGPVPVPVSMGQPMQVPQQVPYATPQATPRPVQMTPGYYAQHEGYAPVLNEPSQRPYDVPPPMLGNDKTPTLWPTPPLAMREPPQRPYDVPPPMLGNDETPNLVPPRMDAQTLGKVDPVKFRALMEKKAAAMLEQAVATQMEAAAQQVMMDEAREAMRKDADRELAEWSRQQAAIADAQRAAGRETSSMSGVEDDGQGAMAGSNPT